MITLPEPLNKVMRSGNLEGIKPFAVLIRNKWYAEESGGDSYFALDTDNPIDITAMIVKPNTLSMTLDVNEVAQYKANNVTLTIYDPFNRFIEGTPISFFPQGYQLYGSQVILYYGLDNDNRTPLFVGVIKDLPTHKPEDYQVDLKLISPLELLRDKEAKDFSNKYYGEILTLHGQDDDNNPIYETLNSGVGGFNAVYANGQKIFEGVDYELSQLNELSLPALVTIINTDLHSAEITADYYCWKRSLTIEQIVSGLVALAGYNGNTDIRSVVWTNTVRNQISVNDVFSAIGYYKDINSSGNYIFNWQNTSGVWGTTIGTGGRFNILPKYFDYKFTMYVNNTSGNRRISGLCIGDQYYQGGENGVLNGFSFALDYEVDNIPLNYFRFSKITNGVREVIFQVQGGYSYKFSVEITIQKRHNLTNFHFKVTPIRNGGGSAEYDFSVPTNDEDNFNYLYQHHGGGSFNINNQSWNIYDNNLNVISSNISSPCIISNILDKNNNDFAWDSINANLLQNQEIEASSLVIVYLSNDGNNWEEGLTLDLGSKIATNNRYLRYILYISSLPNSSFNVNNQNVYYYGTNLLLQMINLSGNSVLDALEDFALISGYEFGIDRQGVFFFRPRSQSTTPVYDLDHNEIVKIDNVQKRFNDFFTKLTLQFGQRPLEFYANEGERPTPIDKYGVINKEIDKPDIVNYDNPELAQAIGPQLLAIYSNLADIIQLTGKLNLNLELGDVVNLKRNYNLTVPNNASDITKFNAQDTYFRACKITGLNYNFAKKQITYTLRDVSNETNKPQYQFDEFVYDFQVPLGVKE